jgi:hypothetical protein
VKLAVTPEIITRYDLPDMPGNTTDSRAAGFVARHGKLHEDRCPEREAPTLASGPG